jgi:hypothetical protein
VTAAASTPAPAVLGSAGFVTRTPPPSWLETSQVTEELEQLRGEVENAHAEIAELHEQLADLRRRVETLEA